jgi:omega-6 fatty acid desaturase (delta-12 desaturase)
MPKRNEAEIALAESLNRYADSNNGKATLLFGWHCALFLISVAGAIVPESLALRILCATLAGVQISALFVIAHDCAHGAFFGTKAANHIVGRLAMLPALHNFTMWRIVHNRWHHATPNVRGLNSWSPMSPTEFRAAPLWRRLLERLYRTPVGFPVYYVVERWLSYKLLPGVSIPTSLQSAAWRDFVGILVFLILWLTASASLGAASGRTVAAAIGLGFAVPYLLWSLLMAKTVYLQHTSPVIPWFAHERAFAEQAGQQDVTMYVHMPRWYGFISNEIMEHTAHHIHPRIPLYNLRSAQQELEDQLGARLIQSTLSPATFLRTLQVCKLYDYDRHCWCDFRGRVTARVPVDYTLKTKSDADIDITSSALRTG